METTKRSFRAARQLKLHQRAVDCLDMIVRCDVRIGECKDALKRWDVARPFDLIRAVYSRYDMEQPITRHEAIKQRLTLWYIDIMARIEDVAIVHLEKKLGNEHY
jgi:hypothetical protein